MAMEKQGEIREDVTPAVEADTDPGKVEGSGEKSAEAPQPTQEEKADKLAEQHPVSRAVKAVDGVLSGSVGRIRKRHGK